MTTLDNGVIVDEQYTAEYLTPERDCQSVFGVARGTSQTCIHHWGEFGQRFDDVVNFLRSRNSREVSAHFVVQDGRVTCLVSPADVAWHAGNGVANAQTIGIECRPEMTQGDIDTLASLIRYLETIYGDQAIYIHQNFANTTCPGRYVGAIDEIISKINGTSVDVEAKPGPIVKCGCA